MLQKFQLYKTLAIIGFLLLPISLFFRMDYVDFHIKATYIAGSIARYHVIFSIIFLLFYFLHSFERIKKLSSKTKSIQIYFTIFGALVILTSLHLATIAYQPGFSNWVFFERNNLTLISCASLYLAVQICYMIYFILKLSSRKN